MLLAVGLTLLVLQHLGDVGQSSTNVAVSSFIPSQNSDALMLCRFRTTNANQCDSLAFSAALIISGCYRGNSLKMQRFPAAPALLAVRFVSILRSNSISVAAFSDQAGVQACSPCGQGFFTASGGQTTCVACPAVSSLRSRMRKLHQNRPLPCFQSLIRDCCVACTGPIQSADGTEQVPELQHRLLRSVCWHRAMRRSEFLTPFSTTL